MNIIKYKSFKNYLINNIISKNVLIKVYMLEKSEIQVNNTYSSMAQKYIANGKTVHELPA